jgi:hypothetical protein
MYADIFADNGGERKPLSAGVTPARIPVSDYAFRAIVRYVALAGQKILRARRRPA